MAEVKVPPEWLTVSEADGVVSVTDDKGHTRRFVTNGRETLQQLDGLPVSTTARWEDSRLVVRYRVSQQRELRYTYSRTLEPAQLVVQVQFIERGGRDTVVRVYEPAPPGARPTTPQPASAPSSSAGPSPAPGGDPARRQPPQSVPASGERAGTPLGPQTPDAELKGITKVGLVVEDLTSQAAACGLNVDTISSAMAKLLTDAGFTVARNSDEDTYLYIDIVTTSASTGLCISRFDASLYTHTTARLSYQDANVLVRVLLLHDGGLAGGGAQAHTDTVMRTLSRYVEQFATRMRNAARGGD